MSRSRADQFFITSKSLLELFNCRSQNTMLNLLAYQMSNSLEKLFVIFPGIAKALNSKIFFTARKMKFIECLENEEIINLVTTKPSNSCKVHVIPMGLLNKKVSRLYRE